MHPCLCLFSGFDEQGEEEQDPQHAGRVHRRRLPAALRGIYGEPMVCWLKACHELKPEEIREIGARHILFVLNREKREKK